MKKLLISLIVVLILLLGFTYYYVTANNEIVADDQSPVIQDSLNSMTEEQRADFDQQVADSQAESNEMQESMPDQAQVIASGSFKPRVHSVAGSALIIQEGDKKILRFEDFETDNGPRLHIYLSSGLNDNDIIDLGLIKATKGNVNYEIPAGVDTDKYNKVLVWCVPFKVLFSYAEVN